MGGWPLLTQGQFGAVQGAYLFGLFRAQSFQLLPFVDSSSPGSSDIDGTPYARSFTAEPQHNSQDESRIYRIQLSRASLGKELRPCLLALVALGTATAARRGRPRYLVTKTQLEYSLTRNSTPPPRVPAPKRSSSHNFTGKTTSKSSSSSASSQKSGNAQVPATKTG